jgi:uncharacterized protein YciI
MLYAILSEDVPASLARRREAAIAWAAEDPYCAAGVYARVVVKPFHKVLP